MHQGVALPISDIRPDNNIESEIFPPELTREAQNKEVFTPPNHQQMRFRQDAEAMEKPLDGPIDDDDQAFFITEDIHAAAPIKEESEQQESAAQF